MWVDLIIIILCLYTIVSAFRLIKTITELEKETNAIRARLIEDKIKLDEEKKKLAEDFVKCQPITGPVGGIFMVRAEENLMEKPLMHGLWRDNPATKEGKYLVKRRDGSVVEWPNFTLGARDPCAPTGLRAYADKAQELGLTQGYADSVRRLADEFDAYRQEHGDGDPDRGQHRTDDPDTINEMRKGKSV